MMYVPDPTRGLHGDKNLETISKMAATEVVEAQAVALKAEDAKRHAQSQETKDFSTNGTAEGDLMTSIAAEACGIKGLDDLMSFAAERREAPSAAERNALGGFIGDNVQTLDDLAKGVSPSGNFTIGERCKIASKSLTGESEAEKDGYTPSTAGLRGADTEMVFTEKMANEQKHALAERLIQERNAEYAHHARSHGMVPGGMGGARRPDLLYAPKPPSFRDDDAAESVTV